MRARAALAQNRGGGGFHGDDLGGGFALLEELARAAQRAARTDARNKNVDFTVGVGPDLGAGRLVVRLRVRRIDELPGDEAVRRLRGELLGLGDGALHALGTVGEDELRAVGLHQLAALDAHGLRHDDDDAVAARGGDGGEADTGVAGGRLDDNGVGLQLAAGLGVIEDGLGDTILDGAGGVEVFKLGEKLGFELFCLFDVGQFEKRGLADQLVCGSVDLAHNVFLLNDVRSITKIFLFSFGFSISTVVAAVKLCRSNIGRGEGMKSCSLPTFQVGM